MTLTSDQAGLVIKNIKLVYSVLYENFKPPIANESDLIQGGLYGLCIAASRYREGPVPFSSYACLVIKGYLLRTYHESSIVRGASCSLFSDLDIVSNTVSVPESFNWAEAFKLLSASEKIVIESKLKGLRIAEIAELIHLSNGRVSQLLRSGIEKIREVYREGLSGYGD